MAFKIDYTWKIKHDREFPDPEKITWDMDWLYSPIFNGSPDEIPHSWQIGIEWSEQDSLEQFGILLYLRDEKIPKSVFVKYHYELIDFEDRLIDYSKLDIFSQFDEGNEYDDTTTIKLPNFKTLKLVNFYLQVVTDESEIGLFDEIPLYENKYRAKRFQPFLGRQLLNLYQNGKSSDVTIVCAGQELKVHKFLLMARSSVFRAMFESGMKESLTDIIPMEESDPEALKVFVEYLYSGVFMRIPIPLIAGVLDLSEQHHLSGLKRICGLNLVQRMDVSNAVDFLVLAEKYKMVEAKKAMIKFVADNFEDVKKTDGWKGLRESDVLKDICVYVLEK